MNLVETLIIAPFAIAALLSWFGIVVFFGRAVATRRRDVPVPLVVRFNPCNALFFDELLTDQGRRYRKWGSRCLVTFVAVIVVAFLVGVVAGIGMGSFETIISLWSGT